jgi:hypothetical protein
VRGEQHRGTVGDRLGDQVGQEGARGRIEPGVRLIEQPQGRPAGEQRGEGDPTSLPGRETADRGGAQTPDQSQTFQSTLAGGRREAEGPHGKPHVLRRTELVVEGGGMAQKTDVAAHGGMVRHQIDPEHLRRPGGDGQQAGAGPEQAGLSRPVGADHQHDLSGLDREIDTGKGGEAAGKSDGSAELDDRGHGLRPHGRGGGSSGSKRRWAGGGP